MLNQCISDYYWRRVTFLVSVMKHIILYLVPLVLLVYTEVSCPPPAEKMSFILSVTDLVLLINLHLLNDMKEFIEPNFV